MNVELDFVPATRISKQKDMWHIYVPQLVQLELQKYGFEHKNIVLWKIKEIKENEARIELIIVKESRKIYKLSKP